MIPVELTSVTTALTSPFPAVLEMICLNQISLASVKPAPLIVIDSPGFTGFSNVGISSPLMGNSLSLSSSSLQAIKKANIVNKNNNFLIINNN